MACISEQTLKFTTLPLLTQVKFANCNLQRVVKIVCKNSIIYYTIDNSKILIFINLIYG